MLDENQRLKNRCLKLEQTLTQTQNESARRIEEAINASQEAITASQEASNALVDRIEDQQMKISALLRRALEAESREAQLKERVEVLQCGEPRLPAPSSSRNANLSPCRSGRPNASVPVFNLDFSADEVGPAPRRSQQGFDATRIQRRREPQAQIPWSDEDADTLVRLIGRFGPKYSKLQKKWEENFPDRHPRGQGQMKDKARNLKIFILK